jgi:hypothetical protein
MSYSPQEVNTYLDAELKDINKKIRVCEKVVDTLNSAGWKDIISPIIDTMIMDVVGGKIGDTWISGKIDKARKDERREFYIGYKQALIDLHGRIQFHQTQLTQLKEKHKELIESRQERFKTPLVEDSRYAV